jgi:glutaredoxin
MKLEVYTMRDCEFCRELKDTLLLEKIAYTEVPIEENWRSRLRLEDDHGVTLYPALKKGEKVIDGNGYETVRDVISWIKSR